MRRIMEGMMEDKKLRHKLKRIEGHSGFYLNEVSGVIYYKDEQVGKFSTGKRTIREAKRAAEEKKITILKNRTLAGAKRDVMKIDNPLISELWFEMLEEKRIEVEPTTFATWERSFETGFREFFSGKDRSHINDITDQNLMKFKKWYLEIKAPRHAKKMVVHMRYFIKWCFKQKVMLNLPDLEILDNLHELVEKKANRKPVMRIYDEKTEVQPMIAAAKEISTRALLMLLLGVRLGLRKESEGLFLTWNDVDLKEMIINVRSKKNHKWRTVPLPAEVFEAFKEHKKLCKSPTMVFPMRWDNTRPISGHVFDEIWKEIKAKAGIRGRARFHDLRHTFATRTAEDGWAPIIACEVLDMSLGIYQKTYCHPSKESVAEMMRKTHEKTQLQGGK